MGLQSAFALQQLSSICGESILSSYSTLVFHIEGNNAAKHDDARRKQTGAADDA